MSRILLSLLAAVLASLIAWGGPAASRAHAAGAGLDRTERSVVRHVNRVRAAYGLPRVRKSRALSRAADAHSWDMLAGDFFAHGSSDGTPFEHRVRRFAPASAVGETLAVLGRSRGGAGLVVRMWMNSAPHRAVLLEPGFRRIGVGRRVGSLGGAWQAVVTADFASRR